MLYIRKKVILRFFKNYIIHQKTARSDLKGATIYFMRIDFSQQKKKQVLGLSMQSGCWLATR